MLHRANSVIINLDFSWKASFISVFFVRNVGKMSYQNPLPNYDFACQIHSVLQRLGNHQRWLGLPCAFCCSHFARKPYAWNRSRIPILHNVAVIADVVFCADLASVDKSVSISQGSYTQVQPSYISSFGRDDSLTKESTTCECCSWSRVENKKTSEISEEKLKRAG
ncbi:hypothetical protein BDW60DRAFT_166018 [Aspergillus nidulans var. acristatus]